MLKKIENDYKVLIGPCGIEIIKLNYLIPELKVLIGPCGIEIYKSSNKFFLANCINWTVWN